MEKNLRIFNNKSLWMLLTIMTMAGSMLTSCGSEDLFIEKDEDEIIVDRDPPVVNVTSKTHNDAAKATIYNIEYSSLDPYGNPAMLSGTIIFGDEVLNDKHAAGMVLYNHFTVYAKHECPSKGNIAIPLRVVGSDLVIVAADYYGFGSTEDKNQAYCISRSNAQASVDALLAARELLKNEGYTWGNYLFNTGYSEGGQTTIGVLRLCAESYPDIKFTHSIAGGGPYDIGETYRQLIAAGETAMPSTVVSSLLAYNEYHNLNIDREDIFKEPTLSNIDTYLLSKNYSRGYLEGKLATTRIADWMTPDMLDFNSDISRTFMQAFDKDNLTTGWTPRKTERITLVHNTLDTTVPVDNVYNLSNHLKQQGLSVSDDKNNKYNLGNVYVYTGAWTLLNTDSHEAGAVWYIIELINTISKHLGISPWITAKDLL